LSKIYPNAEKSKNKNKSKELSLNNKNINLNTDNNNNPINNIINTNPNQKIKIYIIIK
jgi:hypothetical protein